MRSPDTETFASLDALPDDAVELFGAAESFFSTRAWWEIVLAYAIPPNARPCLVLIRDNGAAAGLFPMLREANGFRSLTTPYTCLYAPLIGAADRAAVFARFARFCREFPTTRVDALDAAVATEFAASATRAGLAVARFDHFGNWREDIAGQDWAAWLAARPGALRETIRRRTRRGEQLAGARFEMFDQQHDLATGVAAFEAVYARSWKEPEPYPEINPAQIRAAGALDLARVGVWWAGDAPVAAQFWIVERRRAMVLKLAHDEAFKAYSPGTVLTAWMIRHMIEQEHVTALDFGRGDDPYKRDWVAHRGRRLGLLLVNRRHLRGMLALARHTMGRIKAGLRRVP